MKKINASLLLLAFPILFFITAKGQLLEPVKWNYSIEEANNEEATLIFKAKIEPGWHLYSKYFKGDGPLKLDFSFEPSDNYSLIDSIIETQKPKTEFDDIFKIDVGYFSKKAVFKQKIKVLSEKSFFVKGEISGQACREGECVLAPGEFSFQLNKAGKTARSAEKNPELSAQENLPIWHTDPVESKSDGEQKRSYWSIFIIAFLGGLAALLTPCVFPMIPLTVSYFTKQSLSKAAGIKNAVIYGLCIILIYVILGTLVTAIFGADSLNVLSTNPWFNLFFFALLVVFAISFLGAFEIVLPSSWVNKVDKKADKGGIIGIFFMAFALALVSFSCTGPIVGTLIVEAASLGGLAPVFGMLGFALAIALPFALFAAFPGWMNSLPKSGGWLNSVKVVLGFLELALAFKFLSVADMVWDLHILEREVFIAIWIVIFGLLGIYLLGKLRMPHDSKMEHTPVIRLLLSIIVLSFVVYITPGLWGAPVKLISGFPPPKNYAESPWGIGNTLNTGDNGDEQLPAHMHYGPHGIPAFDDYEYALDYAKETSKPLLLDFTGYGCVNCRKMEDNVWSDPDIQKLLAEEFILVSLYVDDNASKLLKNEVYVSPTSNRKIKTVGNKWSDFQITRFSANSQPYYVILNSERKHIGLPRTYNTSIEAYKDWLQSALVNTD